MVGQMGTDPLSRYQATLSGPQGARAGSRSVSGYDAFGNPLRGSYVSGDVIERHAQDRLFAQITGATAAQLLGPGAISASSGRLNQTFLRPDQMEALVRMRRELTGGGNGSPSSSIFPLPEALGFSSGAGGATESVPSGIPTGWILGGVALFLLVVALRRRPSR